MIAKLSGILDSVSSDSLILDVNGVGYLVTASKGTLSKAGQIGEPLSLFIETQIREDAFNLFGFLDQSEQSWFKLLLTVQGVGAKAALSILSTCSTDQITLAIASSDKAVITRADGVGPKLATRILTELKDKVGDIHPEAMSGVTQGSNNKGNQKEAESVSIDHDAVSALINLGYGRSDAFRAVIEVKKKTNDNNNLSEIIKMALKELA
jgi:Holliday junction DNA helicase RuvA